MSALLLLPVALALTAASDPSACREVAPELEPLAAHCFSLAARPRLPLPSREDREALTEVLSRPELRRARADPAELRRVLAGLWARVMELLGTAEAERYASVGRTIFIAAGLVAALAGLAAIRRRRSSRREGPGRFAQTERAPLAPPDQSAALAETALARGDLAGAVRHAFLSALASLEAAGGLPRDRTLTNRELAARLHARTGTVAADFGALGRTFDGAVYGDERIAPEVARECLERARRIRGATGEAP